MTEWQVIWLAVIAMAVLVMAVVQVVVVIRALRLARDASESLQQIRREVQPLLGKANRISDDAARATALAVTQVERVDEMMAAAATRLDDTLTVVQGAIVEPVKQGAAVVAAVRAAVAVLRGISDRQESHQSEEEALFVG